MFDGTGRRVVEETWARQRDRHATEEYLMVRLAFELESWNLTWAARRLGCSSSWLYRATQRHRGLHRTFIARRATGRPRKESSPKR